MSPSVTPADAGRPDPLSGDWGPETGPARLRLRVLVVDDNPDAADAVATLLRFRGAKVLACYGGAEAVAALDSFRPEACLIDLTMPGVDGCEVARRVRAGPGGDAVLLVALTGLDEIDALGRIAGLGFDADFTKPADPAHLLGLLAEHARRLRDR
jgi:CheY-like chemotaxis protein